MNLPDELWQNVLGNLYPRDIARVERVCRQWHRVARSSTTLYEDAVCLTDEWPEWGVWIEWYCACLTAILQRSGGHLRSLELRPSCSKDALPHARRLGELMASSNVQHLYLHLDDLFVREEGDLRPMTDAVGTRNVLLEALLRCGHLTTLHIHFPSISGAEHRPLALEPGDFARSPFGQCKLRTLKVKDTSIGHLANLLNARTEFLQILDQVVTLDLDRLMPYQHPTYEAVLLRAKHTLEACTLGIGFLDEVDENGEDVENDVLDHGGADDVLAEGQYDLPRLRYMHLRSVRISRITPTPFPTWSHHTLACPSIRVLEMPSCAAPSLVQGMLNDSLEELFVYDEKYDVAARLLPKMHDCRSLRSFAIIIRSQEAAELLYNAVANDLPSLMKLRLLDIGGCIDVTNRLVLAIEQRPRQQADERLHIDLIKHTDRTVDTTEIRLQNATISVSEGEEYALQVLELRQDSAQVEGRILVRGHI